MVSNFSIKFQIIRENESSPLDFNRVPSVFENNTLIEVSGYPPQILSNRQNIFNGNSSSPSISEMFEHMASNIVTPSSNNNTPQNDVGLIDIFSISPFRQNGEIPFDNMLQQFINQTFTEEQQNTTTATDEMMQELGSYKRLQEKDELIGMDCSVCKCKYKKNEGIRKLPCNHTFHKRCIDRWLKNGGVSCPICRKNPFDTNETV